MKSRQFLVSALVGAAALVFSPFSLAAGGAGGGGGGGGGGGAGGGGGGGGMQLGTSNGLYLVDNPEPGEASIRGLVVVTGGGADTVVTINGTPLINAPGLASNWFKVDPAGPQPVIGNNGTLTIQSSSKSLNTSRTLSMQCPARVALAATPGVGSSLNGVASVSLAWTQLPQNVALVLTGTFMDAPMAVLSSYDIASNTVTGGVNAGQTISQSSVGVTLPVQPAPTSGYLAQLSYPGVYVLDGNSGGNCGRVQRAVFTN
jgi:hypothetical protein